MNSPQPRTAAIAKPIRMGRVSPRVRLIAMEVPAVLLLRDKGPIKAWFRPGPPKWHLACIAPYAAGDGLRSARPCPCGTFRPTVSPFVPKSRHEFWNGLAAKSKSSMKRSEPGPALRRPTGGRRVDRWSEFDNWTAYIRLGDAPSW